MPKSKIHKRRGKLPSIEVVDLFCGIGGLSYGMKSKVSKSELGSIWIGLVGTHMKPIMERSLFSRILGQFEKRI